MSKSDHKFFNCSQDHEYTYVIYTKYKRTKYTKPSALQLETYIKNDLCKNDGNMLRESLYKQIEERYPELVGY